MLLGLLLFNRSLFASSHPLTYFSLLLTLHKFNRIIGIH